MPSGLLVPCSITRCLIVNVRWINNHIGPGSPRSAELRELVRDQAEKLSTPEMKGLQAVTDRRCQKNPGKDTSSLIKLSLKKKKRDSRNKDHSLSAVDSFPLRPWILR